MILIDIYGLEYVQLMDLLLFVNFRYGRFSAGNMIKRSRDRHRISRSGI